MAALQVQPAQIKDFENDLARQMKEHQLALKKMELAFKQQWAKYASK
jgi:hypothetical protein